MDTASLLQRIEVVLLELQIVRGMLVESAGRFPPEAEEKLRQKICLHCDEPITDGEKADRGLHHRCYRKVMRQIKSKNLTESTAIQSGWLAPKRSTSGRTTDPLLEERLSALRLRQEAEYAVRLMTEAKTESPEDGAGTD